MKNFNEWLKERQKNEGVLDIISPGRKGKVAREKLTRWAWDDPHYPDYPSKRFAPYEFGKGTGGFYATHGGGGFLSDEEENDPKVLRFYSKARSRRKERIKRTYELVMRWVKKLESELDPYTGKRISWPRHVASDEGDLEKIEFSDEVISLMHKIGQSFNMKELSQDTSLRLIDRLRVLCRKLPFEIQSQILQKASQLEQNIKLKKFK